MSVSVDLLNLILYCFQQAGVMLAVGAQVVLLIAYLVATRDREIDAKEVQFGKAVEKVLILGLLTIIVSGALITLIHLSLGQSNIVETPAFIFKWLLIVLLSGTTLALGARPYPHFFWEGFLGGNWFALFIVHILAPLAAWADLIVIYLIWMIGFMLGWGAFVHMMRAAPKQKKITPVPKIIATAKPAEKKSSDLPVQPQEAGGARLFSRPVLHPLQEQVIIKENHSTPPPMPKPIPPPPPAAKPLSPPVVPKPVPTPMPPPPPPAPKPVVVAALAPAMPHKPEELPMGIPNKPKEDPKPVAAAPAAKPAPPSMPIKLPIKPAEPTSDQKIEDPDQDPGLPAIRVMPRTPQDVDKQMRASIVQFNQE